MKILADNIKQLPKNLAYLELFLAYNNLGEDNENMIYLAECMVQLPNNIQQLILNLR